MRKLTVVAFILKQKMKMTQEENFPQTWQNKPRPLEARKSHKSIAIKRLLHMQGVVSEVMEDLSHCCW